MAQDPRALELRNAVIAKIMAQYDQGAGGEVFPVVTLEDYFESSTFGPIVTR
jgi:hypothetical protein